MAARSTVSWIRNAVPATGTTMRTAAAAAAATATSSPSVFANYPLVSALFAFAVAQSIKFFTLDIFLLKLYAAMENDFGLACKSEMVDLYLCCNGKGMHEYLRRQGCRYKERRWDLRQLVGSGGMPSSHSATVTALAVGVGLQEGFGGSLFATSLILACVVMYDATGVRLQAGRQAEVLNQIVYELPAEHPLAESRPLRELLGHTPPQVVAGGLLGVVTAAIIHLISHFGTQAY
ncbi:hypothetical protein DM860_009748 [Cuscuta australis]|uniref:Uncharacterized protein n=1 Tax=Cuscuta australis TaxID=267555 RepID=A0A328DC27_9ASTE|nr:hypothetical protein DM860_009748 [Cuscuta australis]